MREKTLAFSLFPGNPNEQTSLKPLEQKVLGEFGCRKFIYCSDAGPGSEDIRVYNHMGKRVFTVTRPVKKLKKEWALYQKTIREKQVERVQKMPESGSTKKNRKNPNDPVRFTETTAATEDGKAADIHNYLNENKIYEECFRIMKTDFSARPVYLQDENREIKHLYSHFGCFISRSPVSFCHK